MAAFLRMSGITKRYPGVVACRDITIEVDRGEIRGLLGENGAGKSTLMKVLYGLVRPDEGTIELDGKAVSIRSPRHALDLGIGMVHQHFMLVPTMTVAENIALGLRSEGWPLARLAAVGERVRDLSGRYGLSVDPDQAIEDLSVGQQQRVEILKLLLRGADLLVFDEPTAVLSPPEWRELERTMRALRDEGKALIFISHKLEEQLEIADSCTVLRDGMVVGTSKVADVDKRELARMMVGRDVVLRAERDPCQAGDPVIEVEGLELESGGRRLLDGITFEVRAGEILGVAGVDGNGQKELVEVLTGLRRPTAGRIRLCGDEPAVLTPTRFHDLGAAVIPEDRHRTAVALNLSLEDNLMLKAIGQPPFSRRGIVSPAAIKRHCKELIAEYGVRTPSSEVHMRQLSGGNQQKAVLARELHHGPRLLIAAQPTRGLDVGAMEFVYRQLLEHRARGGAVLLLSAELDEILTLSDRIAVIADGRFPAVLENDGVDVEEIGMLMGGMQAQAAR